MKETATSKRKSFFQKCISFQKKSNIILTKKTFFKKKLVFKKCRKNLREESFVFEILPLFEVMFFL